MVWLTEIGDRFTSYFLHKIFFFLNWKKTHMTYTYCFTIHVNENLKNIFHQELTLDYHCFCGYIYNSMYMYKHEHVPAEYLSLIPLASI